MWPPTQASDRVPRVAEYLNSHGTSDYVKADMSYPHAPPTSTTYPYGAYPYAQTPGAYPYQTPTYQTGVTTYGWPYYGYLPHPVHAAGATAQTAQTSTATLGVPQRTVTIPAHTPSYAKDTAPATSTAAPRIPRKPANYKGLFTKERESSVVFSKLPSLNPVRLCSSEELDVWLW